MKHRIGILTALPEVELPQTRSAFGIAQDARKEQHGAYEYWTTELVRDDKQTLEIVIGTLPSSGNIEALIGTYHMLEHYELEFMVFVGIACGVDCKLGDVRWANCIDAYQYVKRTPEKVLNRGRDLGVQRSVFNDITKFNEAEKKRWWADFHAKQELLDSAQHPRSAVDCPSIAPCKIASGDTVMADGTLANLNNKDDLIRAGEMEGYGFGMCCDSRLPQMPWLVVRGISDFGDASKDGGSDIKKDEYHHVAALSAATFLRVFLQTTYTLRPILKSRLDESDFQITSDDTTVKVVRNDNHLTVTVERHFKMRAATCGTYRFFRSLKGSQTEATWLKWSLSHQGNDVPLRKDDSDGRDLRATVSLTVLAGEEIEGILHSNEKIRYDRGFYSLGYRSKKAASTFTLKWSSTRLPRKLDVFYFSEHVKATSIKINHRTPIPESDSGIDYVLRWIPSR